MGTRDTRPPLFEVLELAYRLDLPKHQWIRDLSALIHRRRGIGPGVLGYELDLAPPEGSLALGLVEAAGSIPNFVNNTEPLHEALSGRLYRDLLQFGTHCSTIRTQLAALGQSLSDHPLIADMLHASEAEDSWAVHTVNPNGRTLTFATPLAESYTPKRRERELWRKVGVHIAAGYRLRERLGAGDATRAEASSNAGDAADAVLRPDGNPAHLTMAAEPRREALKRAARAIDHARAADLREATDETLEVWRGLLRGTWSLIDWVDTDGARYFLAIRNDPDAAAPRRLTRREAQVATYAAQGHTYKVIGYELGIAISTVATHLRSALNKLGLASRAELAWVHGHLADHGEK
jgi:DNA-binding NarL/FixJ family response regulator